ncbi:unnamed protein product [Lampetra planeri]
MAGGAHRGRVRVGAAGGARPPCRLRRGTAETRGTAAEEVEGRSVTRAPIARGVRRATARPRHERRSRVTCGCSGGHRRSPPIDEEEVLERAVGPVCGSRPRHPAERPRGCEDARLAPPDPRCPCPGLRLVSPCPACLRSVSAGSHLRGERCRRRARGGLLPPVPARSPERSSNRNTLRQG